MCLNGLIRFNFILENISDAKLHIIIHYRKNRQEHVEIWQYFC